MGVGSRTLDRLAAKAREDAFFLGWCLSRYEALRAIDSAALARFLECEEKSLTRLALCRAPEAGGDSFAAEIRRVASFAGCRPDRLAELVREVQVVETLGQGSGAAPGATLMAARDLKQDLKRDADGGKRGGNGGHSKGGGN